MAYRKHLLHHRIKGQAAHSQSALSGQHPAVPGPMVLPLSVVSVYPSDSNYVTLAMQDLAPLTTADGAMVPVTAPGRWDQLALAGRSRHG